MSDSYDNLDDDYSPRSSSSMPMILAALGVGTVVGAIIGFIATPSVENTVDEITDKDEGDILPAEACESAFIDEDDSDYRNDWYTALSPDQRQELYNALDGDEQKQFFLGLDPDFQAEVCSMLDDEAEKQVLGIVDANRKLEAANKELAAAQEELADLKKKRKSGSKRYKELEDRVKELETELVEVKEERDALKSALDQTVAALDSQIEQTRKYKKKAVYYRDESVANQWRHFKEEAKTKICTERRLKGKRKECQALIDVNLNSDLRARYSECVKSHQAVPILREFSKKEARPLFTESLGETNYLKIWGVVFCDPSLPEAGDPDLDDL